jgi:hypothetical protein
MKLVIVNQCTFKNVWYIYGHTNRIEPAKRLCTTTLESSYSIDKGPVYFVFYDRDSRKHAFFPFVNKRTAVLENQDFHREISPESRAVERKFHQLLLSQLPA